MLTGLGLGSILGVSPDSQRFLVTMPTEPSEGSQINVVMGWFEKLKQLAPTKLVDCNVSQFPASHCSAIRVPSPPGAQMTNALQGGPSTLTRWITSSGGRT